MKISQDLSYLIQLHFRKNFIELQDEYTRVARERQLKEIEKIKKGNDKVLKSIEDNEEYKFMVASVSAFLNKYKDSKNKSAMMRKLEKLSPDILFEFKVPMTNGYQLPKEYHEKRSKLENEQRMLMVKLEYVDELDKLTEMLKTIGITL